MGNEKEIKKDFNKNVFKIFLILTILLFTGSISLLFINNYGFFDNTDKYVLISKDYNPDTKTLNLWVCTDLNCNHIPKEISRKKFPNTDCDCIRGNILNLVFGNEENDLMIEEGRLIDVNWRYIPKIGWRIRGVKLTKFN